MPCPTYHHDAEGEIKFGEEIKISGIYEP